MIEIPNKAYLAKTYFPRTTSGISSTYMLKLESELTQNTFEFSGLTDESKSKNYYKFRFDASQLDDGEYNYYVIGEDDNAVLATGLLRIGEVQQDLPEQYNYNPFTDDESDNEIVQYYPHGNFKYRFQEKVFTVIENGEYLITPDEGYDAIAQVELTVNLPIDEYVQSGYTAGFESGFTEGSELGYESGYTDGYQDGFESGFTEGYQYGYESGYTDGYADGYESGFTVGYAEGYESGYTDGYQSGYTDGFADGYDSGYTAGYQSGKTDGIAEQKSKLSAATFVENGVYTREDGYSAVTVDLPIDEYVQSGYTAGYSSGVTDGIAEQKGKLVSTAFTENGVYNKEDGYNQVTVNLPIDEFVQSGYTAGYASGKTDGIDEQKSKLTSTAVTDNGTYTREDGYSAFTVNVPTGDYYNSGYTSGYTDGHISGVTDGINEQKSKLISTAFTDNGVYTKADGYSAVTVNVPVGEYYNSGYTSGYTDGHTSGVTDGINEQKSKLISTAFTENGSYTKEDGYSAVTVNVPVGEYYNSGYTSGKTDGINEQKGKLVSTAVTDNGTYERADGYSAFTVNVPSDINNQNKSLSATTNGEFTVHADVGYSGLGEVAVKVDVPVDEYYDSGYTSGYTDGHASGVTDGIAEQKSKLISTAVTDNGTYEREDGYSAVTVNVPTGEYYNSGYTSGYTDGHVSGVTDGISEQKAKLSADTFTSNGTYERADGYSAVTVSVPSDVHNQNKSVTISANTTTTVQADEGYSGLGTVTVSGDFDEEGWYNSGKTDGISEQKAKLVSTAFTENGVYTKADGYSAVTVNVPTGSTIHNQNKSLTISANTTTSVTFDSGYTGLGTVTVSGDFDEEGWYNSGKTDGINEQKGKLVSTAVTDNGTYERADGYSAFTVNVPTGEYYNSGYTSGYTDGHTSGVTDGINEQKSKLVSTAFTENGNYTKADGYSAVTVSVPVGEYYNSGYTSGYTDGHTSGVTDGINEQKSKLISTAFTSNGTYTKADGYSAVTVSVPSDINNQNKSFSATTNGDFSVTFDTGYSGLGKVDIKVDVPTGDYYNSGYTSGYTDGYTSGKTDGVNEQKGKLSAITITENGVYTRNDGYSAVTVNVPTGDFTLTVNVTSNEIEYLINNASVTVSYLETAITQTYTGSALSFTLRPGVNYSVSYATTAAGYAAPESVTGISIWEGTSSIEGYFYYTPSSFSGLTFNIISGGTIVWKTTDIFATPKTIQYSKDGYNWSGITSSTEGTSINVNAGERIRFKGDNATYADSITLYSKFYGTAKFNIEGNIMSLIDSTGYTTATTLSSAYTFYNLFSLCDGLTSAENLILPATTLTERCYYDMFFGCTNLTTAPELPATTLANYCYDSMFAGCTSLTTAPELHTTTLTNYCYYSMFDGCSNLNYIKCLATDISAEYCTFNWVNGVASTGTFVKAPSMTSWEVNSVHGIPNGWTIENEKSFEYLTFVALEDGTFRFDETSYRNPIYYSLDGGEWVLLNNNTATPTISAGSSIRLKGSCTPYSNTGIGKFVSTGRFNAEGNVMSLLYGDNFVNQTSLSGKTYAFTQLFYNNSKIINTNKLVLPATTLSNYCYQAMFFGCTSLITTPFVLPAKTLEQNCYTEMFDGCSSLTTVPELPATTLAQNCYNAMFNGCTSLATAQSKLPATTLAVQCYYNMFRNTRITTAPELPAATLPQGCYSHMFYGCSNLNYIKCLATDISAGYCTEFWVDGVASSGTFIKAPSMTEWTTGVHGIPSNWTVQ